MATETQKAVTTTDDGWVDVDTESQVIFESHGDTFTGTFTGWTESPTGIAQAHFENAEGKFFINLGWSLKQQLRDAKKGAEYRITYTDDRDTGKDTPMMIFRVQTRAAKSGRK